MSGQPLCSPALRSSPDPRQRLMVKLFPRVDTRPRSPLLVMFVYVPVCVFVHAVEAGTD